MSGQLDPLWSVATLIVATSCCGDSVGGVELALTLPGSEQFGYATVGDTATVWAGANTGQDWPTCMLYVSRATPSYSWPVEPERFVFRSTDPAVAEFGASGHLTVRGAGQTRLTAEAKGVSSPELLLAISPPVSSLRVTATPSQVRVGEGLDVRVVALSDEMVEVNDAYARAVLVTPTDSLASWDYSALRLPLPEYYPTPVSARVIARRPGVLLITAVGGHLPGRSPVLGDTVRVPIAPE